MNRPEAYSIIAAALERYRGLGFPTLRSKVGSKDSEDVIGPSGVRYTLDISVGWSDAERRGVTIHGRIDDQNSFHSVPLEERVCVSDVA
jgi:hypothetical protein